jgi:GntR family transcriptional regulator
MQTLSVTNPLPLYAQLAELLRQRIARGVWQDADRLPSLEELTREFEVARVTVRQAIGILQSDGLVRSRQGRGTFVTAQPGMQRRMHVQTTLQSLVGMLQGDEPRLLNIAEGSAAPRLTDRDGLAAPDYVFMRRVHLREDTPYCVISIYLDERLFRQAPERFRHEVMIPILVSLPGVRIAQARQTLTIGAADAATAAHLRVPVNAPVAEVRRVFRAPDGTVIYLGEVTYRGDLVELEMDLVP